MGSCARRAEGHASFRPWSEARLDETASTGAGPLGYHRSSHPNEARCPSRHRRHNLVAHRCGLRQHRGRERFVQLGLRRRVDRVVLQLDQLLAGDDQLVVE
jgi:hypothetical protein